MPFTEQDLLAQIAMFEELKEEFSRLQMKEATIKKEQGISDADLKIDFNKLSQEDKNLLQYAQNEANKAGSARASQSFQSNVSKAVGGTVRKGAIRL